MKVSRMLNALIALFLIAGTMVNVQPAAAQNTPAPAANDDPGLFVPGELIITYPSGKTTKVYTAQASALAGQVGAEVVDVEGNMALLSFAEDADVVSLAAQISANAGVKASPNYIGWIPEAQGKQSVDPNYVMPSVSYRPGENGQRIAISRAELSSLRSGKRGTPTYPLETTLDDSLGGRDVWGWEQVQANVIWSNTVVAPVVCVIDTGVDGLNPDLAGKVTNGKDFVNEDLIPNDDNGHGTHVAGVIVSSLTNKKGIVGVSNGKVLAVKALTAQGWGTTFDLIEALNFCSLNTTVRVINLSVGGFAPSEALYNALNNAINVKKKLVVAAAGNDSSSEYSFPAAWAADFVCSNGTGTAAAGAAGCTGGSQNPETLAWNNPNLIHSGLISVGAGYSLSGGSNYDLDTDNGLLWVDVNNDGQKDDGEEFFPESCLADFSNYGKWVQMVAPGDNIYSTLPISYPYTEFGYQEEPGYGYMSGTSMAAPYVSGAAARVLSVNTTWTLTNPAMPGLLKDKLIDSGKSLDLAVDSGIPGGEESGGYFANGYDPDLPSTTITGEVPYCVPAQSGSYTIEQDMSDAAYLDVASAMGRTAITVYVQDATTGLPLAGATVQAVQGTTVRDTATVSKDTSLVELINIPTTYIAPVTFNTIKVNKAGYATAAIVGTIDPAYPFDTNEYLNVSVPPNNKFMTLVVDWDHLKENEWAVEADVRDLDLFTFLPNGTGLAAPIVGNPVASGLFYDDFKVEAGSLYLPLAGVPNYRTRWHRDGGSPYYDRVGVEAVSMMPSSVATNPFWNVITLDRPTPKYEFYLTEYGMSEGQSIVDYAGGNIMVRFWRAGIPVKADNIADPAPFAYSIDAGATCNAVEWLSGTVNVVNSSPTVTGVGTTFQTDFVANDKILIQDSTGEDRVYEIQAVSSNTSLTLKNNYQGASESDLSYRINALNWLKIGRIGNGDGVLANLGKFYIEENPCVIGDALGIAGNYHSGGFPYSASMFGGSNKTR